MVSPNNLVSDRNFLRMKWLRDLSFSTWPYFLMGAVCQAGVVTTGLASLQLTAVLVSLHSGTASMEDRELSLSIFETILDRPASIIDVLLAIICVLTTTAVLEYFVAFSISGSHSRVIRAATAKFFVGTVNISSSSSDPSAFEAVGPQRWLLLETIPVALHNVLINGLAAVASLIGIWFLTVHENFMAGLVLVGVVSAWAAVFMLFHRPLVRASARVALAQEEIAVSLKDSARSGDTLASYPLLGRFVAAHGVAISDMGDSVVLQGRIGSFLYAVLTLIVAATPPILAVIVLISSGMDTASSAAAVFIFSSRLQGPLSTLSQLAPQIQTIFVNWRRMDAFLDQIWLFELPQDSQNHDIRSLRLNTPATAREDLFPWWCPFLVKHGTLAAVKGEVGAGKTMLLRAISGLGQFSGNVIPYVESANGMISQIPLATRRLLIIFLPQYPHVFGKTVEEFFWVVSGRYPKEISENTPIWLRQRLYKRFKQIDLQRKPESLSGGERRVISILAASVSDCCILIVDEPFASLDPSLAEEIREMLDAVSKEKLVITGVHPPASHWATATEVSTNAG